MTDWNDATRAQVHAADPANSTWVSANAGSGKTRVLTDRVARLLLQDVPPQKILCLTYTKAAASHMQNQLFNRLGEWAMLSDQTLLEKLASLGENTDDLTPDALRHARTLFARALETPGGLKIQTIHSFCSSLLRRFPVEAGVSPQFQEMDERSGRKLRADILETMADGPNRPAFDGMAHYLSGEDPDKLALEIAGKQDAFRHPIERDDLWAAFGLHGGYDKTTYLAEVFPDWADDVLRDLRKALLTGKPTDIKNADKLNDIDWSTPSLQVAETLETMFVYESKPSLKSPDCAKLDRFPTADVRKSHPDLMEAVTDLMLRFQDAKPNRVALASAQKALALHDFAQAFLPEYDRRKQQHGWLDFDDLILKARGLLTDSSMAQWVLFKLDGGIDHILVDEAQDTSPEQWAVISRLAEEFSAGQGARDVRRTLFVVGDEKQSIYSFQGADPAAFEKMRGFFTDRLEEARSKLNRSELLYSFRSSEAILTLVDLVFRQGGQTDMSVEVSHKAFHTELPGRVDLWPFLETPEKEERPVWYDPIDTPAQNDPALELAGQIADAIKGVLDAGETLPTTKGDRLIAPGDFLILVQRRSDLFHEIIKALKDRQLPVAGADRLKIGGELAVRDLTALLAFMATPEDDLSLASALRSPLLRWSERDLFQLAHYRGKGVVLWRALRESADTYPQTLAVLNDLLKQADFLRPYELLERILTRHRGREYLIARLGKEAEDGIDALLTQALQYEQMEAPSLTGFLGWIFSDESDIKRQMDTQSGEVRVMTVHGAKGLESPIVILPDTARRILRPGDEVLVLDDGLAVWKTPITDSPPNIRAASEARRTFQEEERMRLLYVALTRAENWLIVCGAGNPGKAGESWYTKVEAGLQEVGAEQIAFMGQNITRYQPLGWQSGTRLPTPQIAGKATVLPDWAHQPAPHPLEATKTVTPSDLGGSKVVGGAVDGLDEEAAKRRGRMIHSLLEHLPGGRTDIWPDLAGKVLSTGSDSPDAGEIAALLDEVGRVLDDPDLAYLFASGTLAEVGITADLNGAPLFGIIDRLVVEPDRILAIDFKSNAEVPSCAEDTPEGLLRQMGAYAAALSQVYPDRQIETAILWTKTAALMPLPHETVTDALNRAPTS